MGFTEAIKSVLSQYAGFTGRARRSEYWFFCLFNMIISGVLTVLYRLTGAGLFSVLSGLVSLALIIPGLAVAIRRMHDIGKSGWYLLFAFIPLVGSIIVIVWYCKDSEPGTNVYGPNPKGM